MLSDMADSTKVVTPNVNAVNQTEFVAYDCLLATGFSLCLLVGLPGNCLALSYFIKTKKRNLSTLLYIAACSFDMISSVIHLPLTFNLFNKRQPGLLGNKSFCSVWLVTFGLAQQVSMFVALMISVSRTISIIFPFYKINKNYCVASIIMAVIYHLTWGVITITIYDIFRYSYGYGYCEFYSDKDFNKVYWISHNICTGIPPVLIFLSLVASIIKLRGRSASEESNRAKRRSSLTIIYFSVIFLVCNTVYFLNNVAFNYTMEALKLYPGPIYGNNFMFFYSWIIGEFLSTVLNASLNPVLYLCRMTRMRTWLLDVVRIREL
ncbi:hypothetical protein ACHWQZ_G013509 [Mnemiopsis leidyi]